MGCSDSRAAQPEASTRQYYDEPVLLGRQAHRAHDADQVPGDKKASRQAPEDASTVIWRSDAPSAGLPHPAAPPPSSNAMRKMGAQPAGGLVANPAPPMAPPTEGSWGSGQRDRLVTPATTATSHEDAYSGSVSAASESTGMSSPVSSGNFPEAMTPLDLVQTGFRTKDFRFDGMSHSSSGGAKMASWSARVEKLGFAAKRFLEKMLPEGEKEIRGHISKLHDIIMSNEDMRNLGIVPETASLFAFSYPVASLQDLQVTNKDAKVPDIALLVFGGFMYFDSDLNLQDVRAVVPSKGSGMLRFRAPTPWKSDWTSVLGEHRWKPVTLPALRKVGVRYFCWLLPGERLPGSDGGLTDHGGFAYIFHEPGECRTLQAHFDTFFGIAST